MNEHDFAASNANRPDPTQEFELSNFASIAIQDIALAALSPGTYLRQHGTNAAHVAALAEVECGDKLPPILVQKDGWRVIDGLHRLAAARLRGDETIRVRFLDCADSEALVLAIKANSTHGLPLSRADRVIGAERVLTTHLDWSDRTIAGMTGLSAKTIATLRSRIASADPPGVKRLGRDGRRRPVVAGDGRRRAAEYLLAHPDAPMREVARESDVSLGTVHDVSSRLRRGDNPQRGSDPTGSVEERPLPAPTALPTHRFAPTSPPHLYDTLVTDSGVAGPHVDALVRPVSRNEPPLKWPTVVERVAKDPTVRYTDAGKDFMRWMTMHANTPDGWRDFVDAIPAHWAAVIAVIADGMAKEWSQFSQRLQNPYENDQSIAR